MPVEGIVLKPHTEILRYEQIIAIVREAAAHGIRKIKLTGGEPLIKRNIEYLVRSIADIPGITDLGMTTNGSLLTPEKAFALADAGLMRVNISLDTLDSRKFAAITRCGNLDEVIRGIDAAREAGLSPVKINMVVFNDTTEAEINAMRSFCANKGLSFQTIAHFTLSDREYAGTITTDRPPRCDTCSRLRLTADGYLKSCLFSDHEIKVDFSDIRTSLMQAVFAKPAAGSACTTRAMSQIGG
jgi:cyclic pyranopterin phosphate synthase